MNAQATVNFTTNELTFSGDRAALVAVLKAVTDIQTELGDDALTAVITLTDGNLAVTVESL